MEATFLDYNFFNIIKCELLDKELTLGYFFIRRDGYSVE